MASVGLPLRRSAARFGLRGVGSFVRRAPFVALAAVVVLAFFVMAVLGTRITPYDPTYQDFNHIMAPPGAAH